MGAQANGGFSVWISKQKPSDLFACRWLRAPDLNQRTRSLPTLQAWGIEMAQD